MTILFGVDIAKEINSKMGSKLLPVTLTKVSQGSRTAGSLTDGTNPTETEYVGRGFIEDYSEYQQMSGLVGVGEKKVTLLGASLPTNVLPEPNDKLTVEGSEYYVSGPITRDPAGATYVCKVKG